MKLKYLIIALAILMLVASCTNQVQTKPAGNTDVNPGTVAGDDTQSAGSTDTGSSAGTGTADTGSSSAGTGDTSSADVATGQVKEFKIDVSNFAFTPNVIEVNKGDTVRIIAKSSSGNHGIAIPDFGVSMSLPLGEEATTEFVASTPGTFNFFCNVPCGSGHRSMKGTVVVKG